MCVVNFESGQLGVTGQRVDLDLSVGCRRLGVVGPYHQFSGLKPRSDGHKFRTEIGKGSLHWNLLKKLSKSQRDGLPLLETLYRCQS